MTPSGAMFYVTDYLGSVRAVVDGKTGELYKAAKYTAFGDEEQVMIPASVSTPAHQLATAVLPDGQTLRDGYTGKEAQNEDFGTSYIDFGARQYSPALRRWMTPDPLSEKYYGVSPYAFCNNNPVNFVDPDGRYIEKGSRKEWRQNKRLIKEKIASLKTIESASNNNSALVNLLNEQIGVIKQILATMKTIEKSTQGYFLSSAKENMGGVTLDVQQSLINISYVKGSVENFVHEVTHAGQFETGDIAFHPQTGNTLAQDIYDELRAYQAQICYKEICPNLYTPEQIQSIKDTNGNELYTLSGLANTAPISISINTPFYRVCKTYNLPVDDHKSILPFYMAVPMYYKIQH